MPKSIIHLTVDSGPKQGETLDRKPGSVIRIGRVVKGNTLAIKDPSVSQKHLVIEFDPQIDCWVLRDLDTSNGTLVNGERVPSSASVHLSDGDAIQIGGECSSISVRISEFEGNVEGIKRNGVKKGRGKSKKADDCQEDERNSLKDAIVDSGAESRSEEVAERGRKRSSDGDLTKEEILGSAADDGTEAKDLGRGRRKNPTRGFQENKIFGTGSDDRIEVRKNLGRSGKSDDCHEIKDRNRGSHLTKHENFDSVMQDETKESPKHLAKGRTRKSTRGSKKIEELQKLERGEERSSSTITSRKDEILEKVSDDRMKAPEKLGRGRKRKSTMVSATDGVVDDNINVSTNLTRRTRTSSAQVLEKDPSLNLVVEGGTVEAGNFKKQIGESFARDLIHNKSLEPAVETFIEAPKNLRGRRRSNLNPFPKKDEIQEDSIKVPKATRTRASSAQVLEKDPSLNLAVEGGTVRAGNFKKQIGESFARDLIHNKSLEPSVETFIEAPKNLRGRRRSNFNPIPKKDEILEDGIKVPKARRTRTSSAQVLEKDPSLNLAVEGGTVDAGNFKKQIGESFARDLIHNKSLEPSVETFIEAPKNLRGRRRSNLNHIPKKDEILEDSIKVPKARTTRTSSAQVLEKDPSLNLVVEGGTVRAGNFKKQIGESFARDLIHTKSLEPAVETFIEAPKNLRGRRRSNLNHIPQKDDILENSIKVPKATGGGRRTRSTNISEKDVTMGLVNEDKFQAPKNVGRGRRTSSIRVSKLDDNTLDSVLEDGTEVPKNLRRGKRTANSCKVSKTDGVSDVVLEDAVEVAKNVGRGKPRRAPARRTRASSRVSEDEKPLQPAQSNLKDPVLNRLESLYQSMKPREGSQLLCQSDKINQTPQIPSSHVLKVKRSRVREDKENNALVKSQKIDRERTTTRNSSHERNSDGEMHLSGRVNKPSYVLPKAWNGNGIPNTTTKYKEDSKVSWHATPFEERLEKALSDDKNFPQRKVTN